MHDDISPPGVSAADLGGPQMANLGQAVQDLKREKSRVYGDRTLGPEMPDMRRSNIHDLAVKASSLGPMTPLDKQSKGLGLAVSQAQGGESYEPTVLERRGAANHGAALAAGGVRQPLLQDNIRSLGSSSSQVQSARDYASSIQQNQRGPNCGSTRDLSDVLGINQHELLGSEAQRTQGLVPQPHVGKAGKHLGQGEGTYQLPLSQAQDGRSSVFSLPQVQGSYLSAVADGQGVKDLVAKEKSGPRIRGTVAVENHSQGSLSLQAQGGGSYGPVIPGGLASVEGQEAKSFTADGQKSKHLSHAESKALSVPGQTGRNDHATSKSKALTLHTIIMSFVHY